MKILDQPRHSCQWKLAGTETFRLSSTKIFGKWGTNMQNPSKHVCQLYLPDTGKILVQADQSGAEARVVAYLCEAGNFRDLFIYGIKPHVYVALHVFADVWAKHCPDLLIGNFTAAEIKSLKTMEGWKSLDKLIKSSDNWPASSRYYFIAKMVCHASNYGMQAREFQLNVLQKSGGKIALTLSQCEKFLSTYHTLFPEIKAWHREIEHVLRTTRTLRNLFGYPRTFYGAWTPDLLKQAYAFIPQSTVGTITNIAFSRLQFICESQHPTWDVLNNKHDSILAQCPIGEERELGRILSGLLEVTLTGKAQFKMGSEVTCGYNWAPASDKNPNGMRELCLT